MEQYLPTCLDSLLQQGLDPAEYEVIIVNDGSKDGTLAVARAYAEKHPVFRVVDKQNAGVGAARNTGLDEARGQYLYFLDPDDYLARGCLPLALEAAEGDSLDLLTFRSTSVGKDEYRPDSASDLQRVKNETLKVTDGMEYIAGVKFHNEIWWYLIRREFMEQGRYRFIEGRWMEDAILTAQLFCGARRMAHLELDLHRYRILPTSAMRNKTPEHYRKVIFDNANAAHVFVDLMASLDQAHPFYEPCRKRLKTRQQSFVFFLLVRLMKSDLPVTKIPEMLRDFKEIGAWPLDQFLGKDYRGFAYSFMVFIFNHKPLIVPFVRVFRPLYRLVQ
jgi:glycosyltransferase involved in cell wall biosynthesis